MVATALCTLWMVIEPSEAVADANSIALPLRTSAGSTSHHRLVASSADDPVVAHSRPGVASVTATGAAFTRADEMNGARQSGRGYIAFRLLAENDDTGQPNKEDPFDKICRTVERVSADNDLPVGFFTRLIWQESGFDPKLVSRKGARGIAQFMPATAIERGLRNPFEPLQALKESGSYLRELFITFGNLGLAAAAYNAGPGRISRWLAGKARLPDETINYVQTVTGHSVTEWASATPPTWEPLKNTKGVPCEQPDALVTAGHEDAKSADRAALEPTRGETTAALERARTDAPETSERTKAAVPERSDEAKATPPDQSSEPPAGETEPWGVQLAGNWEEGKVLASFERVRRQFPEIIGEHRPLVFRQHSAMGLASRYVVRIGEPSRQSAEALCDRLRAANGACLVLANPR